MINNEQGIDMDAPTLGRIASNSSCVDDMVIQQFRQMISVNREKYTYSMVSVVRCTECSCMLLHLGDGFE